MQSQEEIGKTRDLAAVVVGTVEEIARHFRTTPQITLRALHILRDRRRATPTQRYEDEPMRWMVGNITLPAPDITHISFGTSWK